MKVLFPADYFRASQPDELYAEQATAFARLGFGVSTFAFEGNRQFRPPLEPGDLVLYRGWMLDAAEYGALGDAVQAAGGQLFTSTCAYLNAHHLPRWAPLLPDLTSETACFHDLSAVEDGLRALGWERFFIKDFVKSLKTGGGSVIERPEQIGALMRDMEQFRGKIEGGICARRFEEFRPGTERRYFVLDGGAVSPDGSPPPRIVLDCAGRISSRFFSVDVAERADGQLRIVEIGDGQVSDLVGWSVPSFAALWAGRALQMVSTPEDSL
ncbi:ATP-grasp domain-containing protein [Deinococcus altitudinis]|uniref:ATP-grasp domain-containing protein n=1 Tax=Deinococcus altitudinis TaxID=468914 RepID=UPI0038922870